MRVTWQSGGAYNHGRIGDYRCERYKQPDGSLWFLLSSTKKTYLCCKGPFDSPEERDQAIINEVKKRESKSYRKRNDVSITERSDAPSSEY